MTLIQTLKKEWYILFILLLPYLAAPFIWDQLPGSIPTHFNLQGEPGGYRDTTTTFLLFPLGGLAVYFGILLAPYIDPKKRLEVDQKPLPVLRLVFPVLINGLFILILLATIRKGFNVNFAVYVSVMFALLVVGNYLPTIKPNYFIGIRTPWTLEIPKIWKQTHRMGGKLWTYTALLVLLLSFFVPAAAFSYIFFTGIMIMALVPVLYSFYLYHRRENQSHDEDQ